MSEQGFEEYKAGADKAIDLLVKNRQLKSELNDYHEADAILRKQNTDLQAENERLRLEFARLKNWANSPEELDGYDVSDYVDHINYIVNKALKGE